jgi:hypothetical protein
MVTGMDWYYRPMVGLMHWWDVRWGRTGGRGQDPALAPAREAAAVAGAPEGH